MAATNYLFFNGNCAEAMRFYQQTFGGKLDVMSVGDAPDVPPELPKDKTMHANLLLPDGGSIMASDDLSGAPHDGKSGFAIALDFKTVEETTRVYNALAEGGSVVMPLGKTFWSEAFGMVNDRYGTPWMVMVAGAT